MAFARPSLQEIVERIQNDISGQFGGTSSSLRRAFTRVLARTFAGSVHLLYGYLDYISRQVMPDTAEDDELVRWASIFGVLRKPADFATGNLTVQALAGTTIPLGFIFTRQDDVRYESTSSVAVMGVGTVTATIPVRAVEAGAIANLSAGQNVTVFAPMPGMNATAAVAVGGLAGGDDEESIDSLRARLLLRIRQRPQGGAITDYEQWALEVPGVTRVWAYGPGQIVPTQGAYVPPIGEVYVYFVRDLDSGSIFPDAAEVTEVTNYLNARKPVTANVTVYAVSALTVSLTIQISPFNLAVQTSVNAEIDDLFQREGAPGATIAFSRLDEAVSRARGEIDHKITLINGALPADIVVPIGQIPVRGTVTFEVFS